MNFINPYAVETAVNVSLFLFFTMSLVVILKIIAANSRNMSGSFLKRAGATLKTDVLRSPVGFVFILIGFMIRFGMVIPIGILIESSKPNELLHWDMTYKAISHVVSAVWMYIGLAIIFWPTLQKFSFKLFKTTNAKVVSALAFMFWFSLVLFGYLFHYSIVQYITTSR